MMTRTISTGAKIPFTSRLFFKLGLLFATTFLTVVIGCVIYDVFVSVAENVVLESSFRSEPAAIQIDPKLEADLSKALSMEVIPQTVAAKDPFVDQSGISSSSSSAANNAAAVTATSSTTFQTSAGSGAGRGAFQTNAAFRGDISSPVVSDAPPADTKSRFLMREERIRAGQDGGPESLIFAIEDLIPVGVVSGGGQQEEVIFYSQTACRTYSFPVGTRFFDGWVAEIRAEGVLFGYEDEFRTTRLKSWGRSIRPSSQQCAALSG